jgi:hypothetical protein
MGTKPYRMLDARYWMLDAGFFGVVAGDVIAQRLSLPKSADDRLQGGRPWISI